ncbi:hypothetical protein ABK040_015894 [Willaertia magna]
MKTKVSLDILEDLEDISGLEGESTNNNNSTVVNKKRKNKKNKIDSNNEEKEEKEEGNEMEDEGELTNKEENKQQKKNKQRNAKKNKKNENKLIKDLFSKSYLAIEQACDTIQNIIDEDEEEKEQNIKFIENHKIIKRLFECLLFEQHLPIILSSLNALINIYLVEPNIYNNYFNSLQNNNLEENNTIPEFIENINKCLNILQNSNNFKIHSTIIYDFKDQNEIDLNLYFNSLFELLSYLLQDNKDLLINLYNDNLFLKNLNTYLLKNNNLLNKNIVNVLLLFSELDENDKLNCLNNYLLNNLNNEDFNSYILIILLNLNKLNNFELLENKLKVKDLVIYQHLNIHKLPNKELNNILNILLNDINILNYDLIYQLLLLDLNIENIYLENILNQLKLNHTSDNLEILLNLILIYIEKFNLKNLNIFKDILNILNLFENNYLIINLIFLLLPNIEIDNYSTLKDIYLKYLIVPDVLPNLINSLMDCFADENGKEKEIKEMIPFLKQAVKMLQSLQNEDDLQEEEEPSITAILDNLKEYLNYLKSLKFC